MDTTSVLIAFGIPLLGGATFLAYKHPSGYLKLHRSVDKSLLIPVTLVFVGYCFGAQKFFGECLIFVAVTIYLALLTLLPRITSSHSKKQKHKDPTNQIPPGES